MTSPNLSEIVTTTLRNRSGKLADNFTNNNAIMYRLNEKGRIKPVSGGRTIVEELTYQETVRLRVIRATKKSIFLRVM